MARAITNRISAEYTWHVGLVAALCAAYLVVSFVLPAWGPHGLALQEQWFGFAQLRWASAPLALALLALVLIQARRAPVSPDPTAAHARSTPSAWKALAIAVTASTIFFLLRNEVLNTDGQMILGNFRRALRTGETVVTHDEMFEYYLHYRYWLVGREWWGWNVRLTYQTLSCAAGGMFVLLLLEFCRLVAPTRSWALFGLCLTGGYVQLFFGEVENYTLTTTLLMSYLLGSVMFLRGRARIWQPSVLLALAMAFHLLAGFLAPSLAYLWWRAWREGDRRGVLVAAVSVAAILAATLAFFHWNGLPLSQLFLNSHAFGLGGHFERNLVQPSFFYYRDLFNVVVLLAPVTVVAIPLIAYRRIPLHPENLHLVIASVCMLLFVLNWRAQLGVYQDWNLFAPAALPISLLIWRNVLDLDFRGVPLQPVPVLAGLASMHSLAWIVANHFSGG